MQLDERIVLELEDTFAPGGDEIMAGIGRINSCRSHVGKTEAALFRNLAFVEIGPDIIFQDHESTSPIVAVGPSSATAD